MLQFWYNFFFHSFGKILFTHFQFESVTFLCQLEANEYIFIELTMSERENEKKKHEKPLAERL